MKRLAYFHKMAILVLVPMLLVATTDSLYARGERMRPETRHLENHAVPMHGGTAGHYGGDVRGYNRGLEEGAAVNAGAGNGNVIVVPQQPVPTNVPPQ